MSIERIELRKKYYDGNMVREAVMSVTDDYNTIMKLLNAFADQPPLTDAIEVVRCKDCIRHTLCRFEQGLGLDGFCSKGERRRG